PAVFFERAGWSTDASASHTPASTPCPVPVFAAADARRLRQTTALHCALEAALALPANDDNNDNNDDPAYFDLPLTAVDDNHHHLNDPRSPASSPGNESDTTFK
ncbi:hypothetical protein GGI00_003928, partial [Coemansia sp. RSA 2681]